MEKKLRLSVRPMYLYIESLERGSAVFQLFDAKKIIKEKIAVVMPEELLNALARFLGTARKFRDLEAIFLHRGPGSFSAVRSGVLLGNTLAAVLFVPLVSLSGAVNRTELYKKSAALLKQKKSTKIAMPIYNREPNITIKRKS